MNEFTEQFLIEARELTEQASADLLRLEEKPQEREALEKAFRAFHTLKGAAGIMEYAAMERLLHRAEDALQDVRSGKRNVTSPLIDALLGCIGVLLRWYQTIEQTGEMPANAEAEAEKAAVGIATDDQAHAVPVLARADDLMAWAQQEAAAHGGGACVVRYRPASDSFFRGEDPLAHMSDVPGIVSVRLSPAEPWPPLAELQPFDCNLVIDAVSRASEAAVRQALAGKSGSVTVEVLKARAPTTFPEVARAILEEQVAFLRVTINENDRQGRIGAAARAASNVLLALGKDGPRIANAAAAGDVDGVIRAIEEASGERHAPEATSESVRASTDTTIRVEVSRIDEIVNLTGELLVAKNALGHWARLAAENADPATLAAGLKAQHDVLDRHIADLQRSVFDLRVLPMDRVFSRFPRLVRETAGSLGKQVVLSVQGGETRADKAVVEALFEPLLHIVRNAIDHGIEPAAERRAAGKSEAATLLLMAAREGDKVIVEISDDGRGIDPDAIRRIAIKRGIESSDTVAAMSDEEAIGLIFAPGFSTAQSVSDLSGRGVGMGAVHAAIERIGGEVGLINDPGKGLTVRLTLPFTIMLTRVMTVEAGGQTFGVPFDAIHETVRVPKAAIKPLGGSRAFVLRDRTVPVIDLAQSLGLHAVGNPDAEACVLVVETKGAVAGLEIDRPGERLEMMLKPVEGMLAGMRAVAGTSLLGDGQVLIVLDLEALLQ